MLNFVQHVRRGYPGPEKQQQKQKPEVSQLAIFHFSAQIIKRSTGQSVVAAAAYRFGIVLEDERTGEKHDYTRKHGVDGFDILTPVGCSDELKNPATLFNAIEAKENRKDAQLAREIVLALPAELTSQQMKDLARGFAEKEMVSKGMIAALAFHYLDSSNPHCHMLFTMRSVFEAEFGPKVVAWNHKDLLESWRHQWAEHANQALAAAGHEARISEKTLQAQRLEAMQSGDFKKAAQLDRPATWHEGRSATQARRRGRSTARTRKNDEVKVVAQNRFSRHQIKVRQLKEIAEATTGKPLKKAQVQELHARVQVERRPLNARKLRATAIREIRSQRALKSVKSTTQAFIDKSVDEATRAEIMAAERNAEDTQSHIQKIIQQAQQILTTGEGDPMQRHHARNLIEAHKSFEKADKQHQHWKQQRSQLKDDHRELSAKAATMPELTKAQKAAKMLGITSKAQQEMQSVIDQLARIDKESETAKMARVKASADKMLALNAREERYQKFMEAMKPEQESSETMPEPSSDEVSKPTAKREIRHNKKFKK